MPEPARGTLLGFDFGTQRIGVAVGESAVGLAHAIETIHADANAVRFARIAELIAEWQPAGLVVGLPVHMDGTPHVTTDLARKFARRLAGRFSLPVRLVDERLTSDEAERLARDAGRRQPRGGLDALAAQCILQSHLDGEPGVPLDD